MVILSSAPMDNKAVKGRQGVYTEIVKAGFKPGMLRRPLISQVLDDATAVIQEEIRRLRAIASSGELTGTQTKQLEQYITTLSKITKEEREQNQDDKLQEMDDIELLKQADAARKVLKGE